MEAPREQGFLPVWFMVTSAGYNRCSKKSMTESLIYKLSNVYSAIRSLRGLLRTPTVNLVLLTFCYVWFCRMALIYDSVEDIFSSMFLCKKLRL